MNFLMIKRWINVFKILQQINANYSDAKIYQVLNVINLELKGNIEYAHLKEKNAKFKHVQIFLKKFERQSNIQTLDINVFILSMDVLLEVVTTPLSLIVIYLSH